LIFYPSRINRFPDPEFANTACDTVPLKLLLVEMNNQMEVNEESEEEEEDDEEGEEGGDWDDDSQEEEEGGHNLSGGLSKKQKNCNLVHFL
jgi:hypothetical protein